MNNNIVKKPITEELQESYKEYAQAVALERAIPDIKDGLKPVQRKIIFSMIKSSNTSDKPYVKSARIVGDTMGKYHAHGDSSIYGSLVNMAQKFNMGIPIIDGQGNFGTIDGDSAAAMRYTEARLSKYAEDFSFMINNGIGQYVDNFDGTLKEIAIIPTLIPNLLVNGSMGIAVGIATNIPQFSLNEIIEAAIKLINNPKIKNEEIYKIIQGPDFPCGATIDVSNMEEILNTGKGSFDIYATLEERKGNLYITEIPQNYAGSKETLIDDIAKKAESGRIPEIINIEDQSTNDILVELKLRRGSNIEQVKAKLYQYTGLKSSYSVNFTAVNDDKIIEFNLRNYLDIYIETSKKNLKELIYKEIENINKRLKKLNTFLFVSENIELIVDIITNAKDVKSAKNCLMNGEVKDINFSFKKYENEAKKLRLDEEQTEIILQTKLSQLINTDVIKVREEKEKLEKELIINEDLIKNKNSFDKFLIKKLKEISKNFGSQRKTKIKENIKIEKIKEIKIKDEEIYALIDILGYIKFINKSSYSSMTDFDSYKIIPLINTDRLGLFFEDGSLRYIDPLKVGISNISTKGEAIDVLTNSEGLKLLFVLPQKEIEESKILFVSHNGFGKIIKGEEYKPTGKALYKKILASKLSKDDKYILISSLKKDVKHIEVESNDRILKFKISEINEYGKSAKGMILINKKYTPLIDARIDNFKTEAIKKRGMVGSKKS